MTTGANGVANNRLADILFENHRVVLPPQRFDGNPTADRCRLSNAAGDYARPLPEIVAHLTQIMGGWPKRVAGALVAPDIAGGLAGLKSASSLLAHVSSRADVFWKRGSSYATKEEFFERVHQQCDQYESVEYYPHHRSVPRTLYFHPGLPPAQPGRLDELLRFFSPASPTDAILLRSFICTLFWGGSPGARPIFVFANGAAAAPTNSLDQRDTGRGIGKSATVALLSQLCGGFIESGSDTEISKLETRLLSAGARDKRVVRIDNVKSERFSSAGFERLTTTPVISGHRMYDGEGTRPNYLTFAITMNGVTVSEDLASRSVVVEQRRPSEYRATWQRDVHEFIEQHRWEIIAEVIDILNQPIPAYLHGLQRHAEWETEVLGRQPDAQAVLDLLRQRRGEIDGDLETVRSIADALRLRFSFSGTESNQIPARDMVQYVLDAIGAPPNKLKTFLERLKIPGLSRGRTNRGVHYEWCDPERHAATPRSR